MNYFFLLKKYTIFILIMISYKQLTAQNNDSQLLDEVEVTARQALIKQNSPPCNKKVFATDYEINISIKNMLDEEVYSRSLATPFGILVEDSSPRHLQLNFRADW